jgi:hypothetical protein
MVGTVGAERSARTLEFGIYRDGDNNLDEIQAQTIAQALHTSARDKHVEFTVEDTTARRGFLPGRTLRTESYTIADGTINSNVSVSPPHDMAARDNLAAFVARTLDRAETSDARTTWIDLIDHGAGDGGGLEADHGSGIMRADDMAGAIADGVAEHARAHPEDAQRRVDGVLSNQCLMATEGFAASLSHAGVAYLAASPETMLAPGAPTTVASDIAAHTDDPVAMARAVVRHTMGARYDAGEAGAFGPAAAFDVLDLAPRKIDAMSRAVTALNAELAHDGRNRTLRAAIREDARAIPGMTRFTREALPWHADRPAIALYDTLASDGRLPDALRSAASTAAGAVGALVLAHRESGRFAPFGGADYFDSAGPTVHFPVTARQIDTWAPQVSETDNAFYRQVGAGAVARAIA